MNSSNVVAGLSVVVTGVVSPLIAALITRWQLLRTTRSTAETESRNVLDLAVQELARFTLADGHCLALWRRGVPNDAVQATERLKARTVASEGIWTAYGRLCIRFGPDSEVAQAYHAMIGQVRQADHFLQGYLESEQFGDRGQEAQFLHEELVSVRDRFFAAAHRSQPR